jgi:RecJ-like exonuclease
MPLVDSAREGFFSRCLEVGARILQFEDPVIAHHYDADGLASGSIVCRAFQIRKKKYEERTFRKIDGDAIDELAKTEKNIVFVDFGSGMSKKITEKIPVGKIAIIDHHQPDSPPEERKNLCEANCELFGLSGSDEASAASTAYFCFRDLNDCLINELAVVGFVGDMQDKGKLSPSNRQVVDEGSKAGFVRVEKDLRMFGRVSRTLTGFISYCAEPFLPGLSGNEKACALFLHDLGIPLFVEEKTGNDLDLAKTTEPGDAANRKIWLHYYDLGLEDRKKIASALIEYCYSHGVEEYAIKQLVGDVFLFPKEPFNTELFDAYEHSTMLNACGRHRQERLGVSVCLREEGSLLAARPLITLHRTQIRSGLLYARHHVSDFGAFYFLDGRGHIEDSVIGVVCGSFLASGLFKPDKPVIGFSLEENGDIKVSGRATEALVAKGMNLGDVMREATAGIGYGGGHAIAAGAAIFKASLPEGEKRFLVRAKEVIEGPVSRMRQGPNRSE